MVQRAVAPVPRHIKVGGIHRNEQHDGSKRTNSTSARHEDEQADDEFPDATRVGPESFRRPKPRRDDLVEETWVHKVHDPGQGEENP